MTIIEHLIKQLNEYKPDFSEPIPSGYYPYWEYIERGQDDEPRQEDDREPKPEPSRWTIRGYQP